ncbi:MAG: HAMP domain-containing protein [Alphaproteobacteria bacterium]|nr:HAMP domain-containing protein [Alphaproteobacteria bacterium]
MKLGSKIILVHASISATLILILSIFIILSTNIEYKIAAAFIIFVLGSLILWRVTRYLLTPLNDLRDLVQRMGNSEEETKIHLKGTDEVAELAQEFNLMTTRLKQYHQSSLGQLMDTNRLLQTVFDSFPDPIFILGCHGETLSYNHSALEMFGPFGSFKNPLFNAPLSLQQHITAIINQVISSRHPYHPTHMNQSIVIDQNNHKIFLLPWARPIHKKDSGIVAVSLILQNVSQSPLSKVKDHEILATLVHEFKPPLMAVHMSIHACLEDASGALTEKQKDVLSNARNECQALQKMTDDFLEAYRLEEFARHYNFRLVKIDEVIKASLMPLHQLAQKKGIIIALDIPPIVESLKADPQYLESVFVNIINNAISFGNPGSTVTIKVREQANQVLCEIHNEGPVIAKKHQKHIFEKFYSARQVDGKGLGLYIAHEIIIGHGGQMGVKSSKAKGTTFWFTVPAYAEGQD